MARPLPMKFIPQTPIKVLRVEHYKHTQGSNWMIWLTANKDFTLGTFIQLAYNGDVNRVTWHADGSETIFRMTEDDNGT